MSLISLPREITDRIIDTVAEDSSNRETLRICARVGHVFVQRAQHHLFSVTKLNLSWDIHIDKKIQTFLQVLRDGLQFRGIGIVDHIRDFDLLAGVHTSLTYAQLGPTLAALFKFFHTMNRLESLSLWFPTSLLDLGEECYASLFDLCHSPNLKALALFNLTDIPKYFLHASPIKHITFTYFEFLSYPPDQPKVVYQPESITTQSSRFLSVLDGFHGGGGEIERSTRQKEVLAFLKKLDLAVVHILDILSCLDVARFASDTLKEIDLGTAILPIPKFWSAEPTPICPLHYFPNLRILQLYFNGVQTPYPKCLAELNIKLVRELLEPSNLPPSLDKLSLYVTLTFLVHIPERDLDNVEWDLLDAMLTRPPFCAIPTVTISFRFSVRLKVASHCDDDDTLLRCGRELITGDLLPRFTASRPPHSFVLDVDVKIQRWLY